MEQNLQSQNQQQVQADVYVPSSSEKKRAVMMYALFWIMVMMSRSEMTSFDYFHLKQSTWWWICFIVMIIVSVVFLFIPYLKILAILPLLVMVGLFLMFTKQSWDGKYWEDNKEAPIPIFVGIGWWMLDLFEFSTDIKWLSQSQPVGNAKPQNVVQQPVNQPVNNNVVSGNVPENNNIETNYPNNINNN